MNFQFSWHDSIFLSFLEIPGSSMELRDNPFFFYLIIEKGQKRDLFCCVFCYEDYRCTIAVRTIT